MLCILLLHDHPLQLTIHTYVVGCKQYVGLMYICTFGRSSNTFQLFAEYALQPPWPSSHLNFAPICKSQLLAWRNIRHASRTLCTSKMQVATEHDLIVCQSQYEENQSKVLERVAVHTEHCPSNRASHPRAWCKRESNLLVATLEIQHASRNRIMV